MAFPTNDRSARQTADLTCEILGAAPAIAMGELYLATSFALSRAALDATHAMHEGWKLGQAVTERSIDVLLGDRKRPRR